MKKLLLSCLLLGVSSVGFAQTTCANAPALVSGSTVVVATVNGTYNSPCLGGTTNSAGVAMKGVWYKYVATANGEATVSSVLPVNPAGETGTDTRISVLKGTCAALVCVDDADDVGTADYRTTITVPVAAGTTYWFEWDNYWKATGFSFTFNFVATPCVRPGANDFYLPDTITADGASLYWNNAIGAPTTYDVDWSINFTDAAGAGTIVNFPAGATTYTQADLTGLPENLNFRYFVRSNCGATQSAWQGPYFGYLAVPLPYYNDFENVDNNYTDGFVGFTRLRTDADSDPAEYADGGEGNAMYTFNSTTAVSNRWAYSRGITLAEGEEVTINFKTRLYPEDAEEMTMDVTVGEGQSAADQTTVIDAITADNAAEYVPHSVTWTAPAAGVYHFGFHNNSPIAGVQSFMFFDTLDITSILSTNSFISSKLSVYPNPTTNIINIANDVNAIISTVELTDLNGRVVKTQNLNATNGQISISDLSAGMYMMKIKTDQGAAVKKVIKE